MKVCKIIVCGMFHSWIKRMETQIFPTNWTEVNSNQRLIACQTGSWKKSPIHFWMIKSWILVSHCTTDCKNPPNSWPKSKSRPFRIVRPTSRSSLIASIWSSFINAEQVSPNVMVVYNSNTGSHRHSPKLNGDCQVETAGLICQYQETSILVMKTQVEELVKERSKLKSMHDWKRRLH